MSSIYDENSPRQRYTHCEVLYMTVLKSTYSNHPCTHAGQITGFLFQRASHLRLQSIEPAVDERKEHSTFNARMLSVISRVRRSIFVLEDSPKSCPGNIFKCQTSSRKADRAGCFEPTVIPNKFGVLYSTHMVHNFIRP